MEEGIEREKTREELVHEAGGIIYRNLVESRLAEKIVSQSAHARQPFSKDFYDGVSFGYDMGAGSFKNGIWVQPRLSTHTHTQPVTPKLYRLDKTNEGAETLIWRNVTDAHKRALIETAINYQVIKHKGTLASVEAMREHGRTEGSISFSISEANEYLSTLEQLRKKLADNSLKEIIDPKYAGLGVKFD